jgi:hypothetical protein
VERGVPASPRFRPRAFSTPRRFPSKREFHGLVSCRSQYLGCPLQRVPLTRRRDPSRGPLLPGGYRPTFGTTLHRGLISVGFTDSHARERSRLDPPPPMGEPFHEPKLASRPPWTHGRGPTVPPASPASKPCSPCESVPSTRANPSRTAAALLVFRPLQRP